MSRSTGWPGIRVPVVGDLFDVAFRANRRNVKILREHFGMDAGGQTKRA